MVTNHGNSRAWRHNRSRQSAKKQSPPQAKKKKRGVRGVPPRHRRSRHKSPSRQPHIQHKLKNTSGLTRQCRLPYLLTYRVAVGVLSRAAALQYNSPTTPVARCGTALSLRARRAAFARADVAKDLEDAHRRTRSSRVEGGRAVPSALVMRSSHVVRGNGTHVGQVRPALPPHTSALAHSARVRRHAAS
jgi:hypothetical protein